MVLDEREPSSVVADALTRIRRDQQARWVQRRAARGEPAAASLASAARFRYLDALDGAVDGRAISEVADLIGVDRPRASRLTAELLADGLIERKPAPDDARASRVRLGPSGRRLVQDARAHRQESVRHALAGFTAEEAATFAVLLEKFVDAWPRDAT